MVHVRQRIRGDDETLDIVTDAFIRARGHFDRLDHDPLYLHRIARSLIRERREQDHRAPGADVASVIDLEEDPMLSALLTEEQAEVHRAFGVLTAVEREVLELSYAEEMSPTQIAEMTGKSLVAVRALLNEALVKVGMELRILQVDLLNYPPECREIHIPRLPAYLNGRLEGPELEETLRHLKGCRHCQDARAKMRETERRLRGFAPPPRIPSNLFPRIERALEAARSRDSVAALVVDSAEGRSSPAASPVASVGSVGSVGARLPLEQLRARLGAPMLELLRRVQAALSSGWGTVVANPVVSSAVAGVVAVAVTAAVVLALPDSGGTRRGSGGTPAPSLSPSGSLAAASSSQPGVVVPPSSPTVSARGTSGPTAPGPTASGPTMRGTSAPGPTPTPTQTHASNGGLGPPPPPPPPGPSWTQWRHDPAHTGFDPAEHSITVASGRHLTPVWATPTVIGPDLPYPQRTNAGMIGSPVFANGFVYAGSLDGFVAKMDAAAGQKRWEASLGNWIFSTPAVSTLSDGRTFVYVTSSWSGLIALDDANGHVAWRFPLPGLGENPRVPVYGSPAVVGDIIYVADGTGRVYAFDGTRLTPPPASSPSGTEGTNKPIWTVRPTTNGIWATPATSGSLLYILDQKNGMYALRTADGTSVWSDRWDCASVTATDTPVISGTRLFWTANCGPYVNAFVYAVDAATGTLQWRTLVENRIYDNAYYMSSLAVADNTVYVPAPSSLWGLDAGTGTIRWKSPGPIQDAAHTNMFFTSPGVANGLVFVGLFTSGSDSPGGYAVFDAASGAIRVSQPDEDQVYSSPTIADGMIFLGIHDLHPGVVTAYR